MAEKIKKRYLHFEKCIVLCTAVRNCIKKTTKKNKELIVAVGLFVFFLSLQLHKSRFAA